MTVEEQAALDVDKKISGKLLDEQKEEPEKSEPEPTKPVSIEKYRPTPINASQNGVLVGSTFEEQFRLARAYHASGLMPYALNSPEKVLVALQLCHELGLPPMTSVGKIMVLNGTPSIFGDLPLALVRKSGLLRYFREEMILNNINGEVAGAKCICE